MQRSGAVIHEDDPGEVTMILRVPPGSGVTFAGGETEISTTRFVDTGDHHTLLVDWRLVAEPGMRPPHVILEVDLLSEDEGPNTGTVGIQLSYAPVSVAMLLAGLAAAVIAAVLMTKRRKRAGETDLESSASRSEPRTDAPDWSAGPESGRDRSTQTYR
jgi:hypothetical protein